MNKVKKRSEIAEKYKWDLSLLLKDRAEYQKIVCEIENDLQKLNSYRNHLFDSSKTLLEYCDLSTQMEEKLIKIYVWANLYKYEDLANNEANDYVLNVSNLNTKIALETSWVNTEIIEHTEEEFNTFLQEESKLQEYAFIFQNLFRSKEHILNEREEKIISQLTKSYGQAEETYEILNDSENNLGTVTIDDMPVKLSQTNFVKLMNNPDVTVRQNVFQTYFKYYQEHKNTYASLYATNIYEDNSIAEIRKFPNALQMALDSENIAEVVYENLLKAVNKNMNLAHEFQELKAKILKLDDYHIYDNYLELIAEDEAKYPIDVCQNILLKALNPLGSDYLTKLQQMFDSKYIDYYPNENKRSGAYQWHKYVSLNHLDNYDSLTTMAHELGHAINTLYTEEAQPAQYRDNPIFLAEIASTLNEVLLNEYLYRKAQTKEEKQKHIWDFLSRVHATIYRQTMFAEFEYNIHEKEQDGISLTEDFIFQEYLALIKKYFTSKMTIDEEIKYEWMRIPHFYSSFYVYKYAIGLICALIFAKRILNGEENAVDEYIVFLKSGMSDYPLNILKKARIDLTKEEVFDEAFSLIKEKIAELKEVSQNE